MDKERDNDDTPNADGGSDPDLSRAVPDAGLKEGTKVEEELIERREKTSTSLTEEKE